MTQTKIQGKFYPLTPELAKKLREAKLTAAEWRFWAYLVEIDPYGDRYHDLNPLTIQTECELSKPTYYRAKAKFQELGIFDFQEEKVSFRNLTGVSKMRLKSQKRDSKSQKRDSKSQKRENESSKPSQCKDSSAPQTYSDFKDSLSEDEREKFLEFGLKKAAELPKTPTLPQKWIERNFRELYAEFSKEFGEAVAPSQDWENHPCRDEWLLEMITKGTGAFIGLAPEQERSERLKFREWSKANNHI